MFLCPGNNNKNFKSANLNLGTSLKSNVTRQPLEIRLVSFRPCCMSD